MINPFKFKIKLDDKTIVKDNAKSFDELENKIRKLRLKFR